MKMRLLLAGASALAITWANAAQAENVGIGVLEPQAVLHVSGELGNADDVIFQNMDGYDGAADNENVLLVDEDDGQRVKTIPLTTLLSDTTLSNSSFDFDAGTNILSITEGGNTLTVDLSSLSDTLSSTDTNTVISSVTYNAGVITITDSDGSTFPVDISAIDTVMINSALTYDDATNVLSITEGGSTLTVDLSDLADSFTDTDTTIVSFDYTAATNILSVVDSAFNQFDVDLTELHDQAVNLGNSDLTQTPAGTNRTYDMSGQVLHFDNGHAMIGSVIDPGDSYPTLEGATQLASNYASKGNLSTPWIHTNFLEAFNERDQYTTGIALGQDGKYNGQSDMINFVTSGNSRLRISPAGQLRAYIYGKGSSVLVGNAATDMFLTVDGIGNIREVAAPSDTTIQNTAAALDGSNVLTITDEAGDVTVDLSGLATTLSDTTVSNTAATLDAGTNVLTITDETGDVTVDLSPVDSDTFLTFGISTLDVEPGIETTTFNYTAADGSNGQLVVTDQFTDTGAALTDNLDGTYTFQERIIQGAATTFPEVVIDTIQNTAASLDGSNVLTITDEAGDVTVDLSGLAVTLSDTTVSNTAATLDAGTNVLTITDETGDVTVDLSPVDTDTTDLDWAVANSASDLATGVGDNIYTNGNVGINTNAPSYPLVVDTAATQNALVVREGTENSLTVGRVGVGTDTPGYSLDVSGDIRATGSIYSGDQFLASNFFQTSDRRLKTEIEGFNRGLEVLRQMRTVSYRYNGIGLPANTDRLHYGVIAQELAEIDPELVGSYYSKEDDMEFLTVNVQSMTYVLANALQQLDAENARIVSLLIESEMRMAQMEDRLNRLEAALGVSDQ